MNGSLIYHKLFIKIYSKTSKNKIDFQNLLLKQYTRLICMKYLYKNQMSFSHTFRDSFIKQMKQKLQIVHRNSNYITNYESLNILFI